MVIQRPPPLPAQLPMHCLIYKLPWLCITGPSQQWLTWLYGLHVDCTSCFHYLACNTLDITNGNSRDHLIQSMIVDVWKEKKTYDLNNKMARISSSTEYSEVACSLLACIQLLCFTDKRPLKSRKKIKPSYLQAFKLLARHMSHLSIRESCLTIWELHLMRHE